MKTEGVTLLLKKWKIDGDSEAEQDLFVKLEGEFLRIARAALRRSPDLARKIDPRELMSEAYLKLREYPVETWGRGPFFSLMSKSMRNFLIDLARHDHADKRPPSMLRVLDTHVVNDLAAQAEVNPLDLYRVHDELAVVSPRQAQVIDLRILGLENAEIAAELGVGLATVKRDVKAARAFFAMKLGLPANWLAP